MVDKNQVPDLVWTWNLYQGCELMTIDNVMDRVRGLVYNLQTRK